MENAIAPVVARLHSLRQKLESEADIKPPELLTAEHDLLALLGIDAGVGSSSELSHTLATLELLLTTSLSLSEAVVASGLEPEELHERLEEGRLLGVWLDGTWRVPAFQLTSTGLLPGLEAVLSKFPRDLDPIAVYGFLSVPQPRLMQRGRMVAPADWLASGGDPEFVMDLACTL